MGCQVSPYSLAAAILTLVSAGLTCASGFTGSWKYNDLQINIGLWFVCIPYSTSCTGFTSPTYNTTLSRWFFFASLVGLLCLTIMSFIAAFSTCLTKKMFAVPIIIWSLFCMSLTTATFTVYTLELQAHGYKYWSYSGWLLLGSVVFDLVIFILACVQAALDDSRKVSSVAPLTIEDTNDQSGEDTIKPKIVNISSVAPHTIEDTNDQSGEDTIKPNPVLTYGEIDETRLDQV